MANLIDKTYFTGKLSIPHLTTSAGVDASLSNAVAADRAIAIYEPEFLKMLLGDSYATYIANKTDALWVSFEAILKDTTTFLSPIANYVFFKFYPEVIETNTANGTIHGISENSIDITDTRLVWAWNDMVHQLEKTDGVLDYLSENVSGFAYDASLTQTINILGI